MIKLRVSKNEKEWFRDSSGRRVGIGSRSQNWATARQLTELALYGRELQRGQALAGIGSDGSPMPGLRRGYAIRKNKSGLGNRRNLYGKGNVGGHMLDAMRINYVSDTRVQYSITDRANRDKARGNERKAPWWGWSPASMRSMVDRASEIFQTGVVEKLFSLGLIGIDQMTRAVASSRRFLRRAA